MTPSDIRKDREAGTLGGWNLSLLDRGEFYIQHEGTLVCSSAAWPSWVGDYRESEANALRIARVPDLEAAYLDQAARISQLEAQIEAMRGFVEDCAALECTCHDGYSGRGLTDPDCRGCEFGEDARAALNSEGKQ